MHFRYEPRKKHAIANTTSGSVWVLITSILSLVPSVMDTNLLAMTS